MASVATPRVHIPTRSHLTSKTFENGATGPRKPSKNIASEALDLENTPTRSDFVRIDSISKAVIEINIQKDIRVCSARVHSTRNDITPSLYSDGSTLVYIYIYILGCDPCIYMHGAVPVSTFLDSTFLDFVDFSRPFLDFFSTFSRLFSTFLDFS